MVVKSTGKPQVAPILIKNQVPKLFTEKGLKGSDKVSQNPKPSTQAGALQVESPGWKHPDIILYIKKENGRAFLILSCFSHPTFSFVGAAATIKIQAYFNETAILPCNFINSENVSLDKLVLFWQNEKNKVLYELYQGKEKIENVDPMYKERHISFDEENLAIYLHNVEIKDHGSYKCFVHQRSSKGLIPKHTMGIELSVVANFSQPEIKEDSNSSSKSEINLTCSSTQGYPQPKAMYFLLTTENSTTKYPAIMEKYQDNITELYNVSTSFYYAGIHNTSNISIQCVLCVTDAQPLQPELTKTCLFSKPFVKDNVKVDMEESEQVNQRVKDQALERPAETQGIANISKTPSSEDNSATSVN
ncbi:T-lymphocyte activation antigen CD86 [Rhynchocyon petersi]